MHEARGEMCGAKAFAFESGSLQQRLRGRRDKVSDSTPSSELFCSRLCPLKTLRVVDREVFAQRLLDRDPPASDTFGPFSID
mmetsp:Transcript_47205/g.101596  ORF Transcript_47205/g.101596 Transcript_47205/m.101596 type:complete len:82 (-) Transcript_47205:1426-1671(-)